MSQGNIVQKTMAGLSAICGFGLGFFAGYTDEVDDKSEQFLAFIGKKDNWKEILEMKKKSL